MANVVIYKYMDYKVLNLKEYSPSVEQAIALFSINLNAYKLEGVKVVKVIHGYGSHGIGGGICTSLRNTLKEMKKNGQIKDYLLGAEWNISNPKCLKIFTKLKDCYNDEDAGRDNPGITIVVL